MRNRILSIVLTIAMVLSLLAVPVMAADGGSGQPVYVAFSSDVHNQSGDASSTRLNSWINSVTTTVGSELDNFGFCGDLGPASGSSSDFWTNAQKVMNVVTNSTNVNNNGFYVCGNHEYRPGSYSHNTNSTTQNYSDAGTYYEGSGYYLYSMGARQWDEIYSDDDINAMSSFLSSHKSFDGPIFILAHFPLHCYGSYSSGEDSGVHSGKAAQGTSKIINVLNNYPNVIFLWGHNHSGSNDHYDKVYTDKINSTSIRFTYAAAGCMSDSEYGQSANVKGKGLVAKVDGSEATLTYYKADGKTVVSSTTIDLTGESDPSTEPGGDDSGGTPVSGGDVEITPTTSNPSENATVPAGSTIRVKVTNGSDSRSYTYTVSSSDTSKATVSPASQSISAGGSAYFTITGVSKGSATINIANDNSYGSSYTRKGTINLTVTGEGGGSVTPSEPGDSTGYTLTNSFEVGKTYVIATVNDGSGVALANNSSDSFATTNVTVSDNKIASVASSAEWTAIDTGTGNGKVVIGLKNGSNVLKVDASGTPKIKTNATSYNAGGFGYTSQNHISYPYGQNPKDYYIGSSNGTFTASSSESGLGKVYIFVKGDGSGSGSSTEPSTGGVVEITPSTDKPEVSATVAAGETIKVKVTNGSSQSAYTFTASSSDTSKATVSPASQSISKGGSEYFTITGVSKGTATITIYNKNSYSSDYDRYGYINLTVTGEGGSTDPDPEDPPASENIVSITPTTDKPSANATVSTGETVIIRVKNTSSYDGYMYYAEAADENIAEVDPYSQRIEKGAEEDFTVKGIKAGTTTINIWNVNPSGDQYTRYATINLTVTGEGGGSVTPEEPGEVEYEYVQTGEFVIGQTYVIATVNNGSGKALTNTNSNSHGTASVTVKDGKIASVPESAEWTAKAAGNDPQKPLLNSRIGLWNGNNVLKIDASSAKSPYIKTSGTSYNAGGFEYTANDHIWYPYDGDGKTTDNEKDYYIGTDSKGDFTASSSESGLGEVYIFVKTKVESGECQHSWNDGAVTTQATCTANGVKTFTCSKCGDTKTEAISALGHNSDGIIEHVDATCINEGVEGGKYCTRCDEGKAEAEKKIPALGHSYKVVSCTYSADYTTADVTLKCENCKQESHETAPVKQTTNAATGEVTLYVSVEEGEGTVQNVEVETFDIKVESTESGKIDVVVAACAAETIFVAVYDSNDRLVEVKTEKVVNADDYGVKNFEFKEVKDGQKYTVKCFFLDDNSKPLKEILEKLVTVNK